MLHGADLRAMIQARARTACWSGTSFGCLGRLQGAAVLVWAAWEDTASKLWLLDGHSKAFQALA